MVHFFWRGTVSFLDSSLSREYIKQIGGKYKQYLDEFVKPIRISTCVYDHLLLENDDLYITKIIFQQTDLYYCSSKKLTQLYTDDKRFPNPVSTIPDGVDLSVFKPRNIRRLGDITRRTMRVGWVGNSKWSKSGVTFDLKGIHSVIEPAVDSLFRKGHDISLVLADRENKTIPFHEMPDFYAGLDVYCCASMHEGTPNPVLEAMACGLPVISTDVGIVPDVFGPLQRQFILPSRSPDLMADMLLKLKNDPELCCRLSEENLHQIKEWDWSIKVKEFIKFFDICLGRNIF